MTFVEVLCPYHHRRLDSVFLLRLRPWTPLSLAALFQIKSLPDSFPSAFSKSALLNAVAEVVFSTPATRFSSFNQGKSIFSSAILQWTDHALQYSLSHIFGICASTQYQNFVHLALGANCSPEPSILSSSLLSTLPSTTLPPNPPSLVLLLTGSLVIPDSSQAFGTSLLSSNLPLHSSTNSFLQPLTHCFSLLQPERSGLCRSLATTLHIFSGRPIDLRSQTSPHLHSPSHACCCP